jgi:hypothetical protein
MLPQHLLQSMLGTEFFRRTGSGSGNAAASRCAKAPRPRRPAGRPSPRYLRLHRDPGTHPPHTVAPHAELPPAHVPDSPAGLNREHPPELWVILDEAVLRRPIGGPDVMRDQLARLVEAGQRPNVAIQVIPFGAGAHEGLRGGAFIVADFDGAATIAYQDAASSGQILEDAAEVDALAVTWDTLRLDALPRTASISLVTSVAEAV